MGYGFIWFMVYGLWFMVYGFMGLWVIQNFRALEILLII